MNLKDKTRYVVFILAGVLGLILKRHYTGPYNEFVFSYLGNVAVSFSVYYIICIVTTPRRIHKLISAAIALAIVELFELTNGYGIMKNVYDLYDLLANLVGVCGAFTLDNLIKNSTFKE